MAEQKKVHKNAVKNFRMETTSICKTHPDGDLVENEGYIVCCECGLVVENIVISDEAEWRNFGDDSLADRHQKSRVGHAANPFMDDNLGTSISATDSKGKNTFASNITKQYARRTIDRALLHAFDAIENAGHRISLPMSVLDRAKGLYNAAYRKYQLKGTLLFTDAKVGACLYIACVKEQCPRTVLEICAITAVTKKELVRARAKMCKFLKIQLEVDESDMLGRFCSRLDLPKDIEKLARRNLENLQKYKSTRKVQPESLAGAAIYLATKSPSMIEHYARTQKVIGEALGISGGTVSKYSKKSEADET